MKYKRVVLVLNDRSSVKFDLSFEDADKLVSDMMTYIESLTTNKIVDMYKLPDLDNGEQTYVNISLLANISVEIMDI